MISGPLVRDKMTGSWLMKAILSFIFVKNMLCTANINKVCTDLSNLNMVRQGVTLTGHTFKNVTTEGLMLCANECLKRSRCQSFNFNLGHGRCELNDVTTISDGLQSSPDMTHANIRQFPSNIARSCANHICALNEFCVPIEASYICETEFPSSCADIRECAPGSDDGEYWIYLVNFDMKKVKIYCHNMTFDPQDYLTLLTPNNGNFPFLKNQFCQGETHGLEQSCVDLGGEVSFNKIRLTPKTLEVVRDDHTFANYTNQKLLYGVAEDCYAQHEDGTKAECGPKGTFTIDLRDTGFAVAPQVMWVTGWSWKPWMIVNRSSDGTLVQLNCGGYPGWCAPYGPLQLVPTATSDGNTGAIATTVVCEN